MLSDRHLEQSTAPSQHPPLCADCLAEATHWELECKVRMEMHTDRVEIRTGHHRCDGQHLIATFELWTNNQHLRQLYDRKRRF